MKTTLEALKEKHAEEIRKATLEAEISEAITAAGFTPRQVFIHDLYGVSASVSFGDTYSHAEKCPLADVIALAEAFPPMPLTLRKDGCTSFVLTSYAESLPPEKAGTLRDIAPWKIEADFACVPQHGHAPTVAVKWVATVAGHAVSFACYLEPHSVLSVSFDGRDQRNAYRHIINTQVQFRPAWGGSDRPVLHHPVSGDNAEQMERIQWGRGSSESGHNFTYYTGAVDVPLAYYLRRIMAGASVG